jgi:hypothetical protein
MSLRSLTIFTFVLSLSACDCASKAKTSCGSDASCNAGFICDNNECVAGCRDAHDRCGDKFCKVGGACVDCLLDGQCSAGQICFSNSCVTGCSPTNTNCPDGQVCDVTTGVCGECASNTDCHDPTHPQCNAATRTCVECTADTQCAPGSMCTNNTCVVGCSAAGANCPSGLTCNVDAGACVECTSNTQCPNAPLTVCDPSTNNCVQCAGSNDCSGATPVCNPSTHTCVACTGNTDCASGVCVNNTCVQCGSDNDCSGTTAHCDVGTHTCVECVPGAHQCPTGEYCRADFTCEQGCETGTDCASGVCLPNHSCQGCTGDAECAQGQVCNNGTCAGACGSGNLCGSGELCCNGHCEAAQNDENNCGGCGIACNGGQNCCTGTCRNNTSPTNCGGCGIVCSTDQFCDGTMCKDKTFPNFCANRNVLAIRDGITADNAATGVLVSTVQQYCATSTRIYTGDDDNPAIIELNPDGGSLLPDAGPSGRIFNGSALFDGGGAYTLVTAGGPFPNRPVNYLERGRKLTKVYYSNNTAGTELYFKQRLTDGGVDPILQTRVQSSCSATDGGGGTRRDTFVVELAVDPSTSSLALISYGLCSPGTGTYAGAWFWANQILPNLTNYTGSWYIVEWFDANGDETANAGDTFTVLNHD